MYWRGKLAVVSVAVIAGIANQPLRAQGVGKYFAPKDQVVAIRAGRLFDSRSGNILNNQVVLITGDRITDIGAAVELPAGTRVLDLSSATVLPGMIDTHVHVNTGGNTLAQRALRALAMIGPGQVATGPVEARDEPGRDGIVANTEDDRNCPGRLLCGERRSSGGHKQHGHLEANRSDASAGNRSN